MKKYLKKLMCLILCAAMVLSVPVSAMASEIGDAEVLETQVIETEVPETENEEVVEEEMYLASAHQQVVAFVTRLYQVVLGRKPDTIGLNDWVNKLEKKQITGAQAAEGFVCSKELEDKNLSNDAYVDMLYKTFLNRSADASGKATWIKYLENGLTRRFVLRGFIESIEFTNICKSYGIERGTITLSEYREQNAGVTMFVWRCYKKVLGRDADVAGLNYWCEKIVTGAMGAGQVAYGFIFSEEFTNKNLNDVNYVKLLYEVFMDRQFDSAGLDDWVLHLSIGYSRYYVFLGFVYSTEFADICNSYGVSVGNLASDTSYQPGSWSRHHMYASDDMNLGFNLIWNWSYHLPEELYPGYEYIADDENYTVPEFYVWDSVNYSDAMITSMTISDWSELNGINNPTVKQVAQDERDYAVYYCANRKAAYPGTTYTISSLQKEVLGDTTFYGFTIDMDYSVNSGLYDVIEYHGYAIVKDRVVTLDAYFYDSTMTDVNMFLGGFYKVH